MDNTVYSKYCHVGRSDFHFFAIFDNGHIAIDWAYFLSSIPKYRRILSPSRAVHARKYFHFQKITGTLKMKIVLKVGMNFPFTSKTNCQK